MLAQAIIPLAAAIIAGFLVHFLSAWRDRINKRRENQIGYLIDAYRRLEGCSNREFADARAFQELMARLESALADIQLFGSPFQVELAQKFAREFAQSRAGNFDELLEDLRCDLRKELGLPQVSRGILHLRYHAER